uniref:Genome polyprotein n=1 Tax=WUHARV Calicivirus 1 TaxID=1245560 RepID=K4P7H9_9CALI|nr:nonstructural polyprotein [WUHARV Calicivirus 1]
MDKSIDSVLSESSPICGADIQKLIFGNTSKVSYDRRPEPKIGQVIVLDEGDCFHYAVYVERGLLFSTGGMIGNGAFRYNGLTHPWGTLDLYGPGDKSFYDSKIGEKFPYSLTRSNCLHAILQVIGVSYVHYKDKPLPTTFYTHVQDWNENRYDVGGTKSGWTQQLLEIVYLIIKDVDWAKICMDFKPLNLWHNWQTMKPTFRGVLAFLTRVAELWGVNISKLITFLTSSLLPQSPFSPSFLMKLVLGAMGFCTSFIFKKSLNAFSSVLRNFNKFIQNWTEFGTHSEFGVRVLETITGTVPPWKPHQESISEVLEDLSHGRVQTGDDASTRIQKLSDTIKDLSVMACDPSAPPEIAQAIKQAQDVKKALEKTMMNTAHRRRPIVVVLAGPPGCGKTTFAKHLATHCAKELKTGVYSHTPGVDHWDAYDNQGVMIWEDFGATNAEEERKLFQRLADTMPVTLNCDRLENKGKFFTSTVIILTTNLEDISSGNCRMATLRRVDFHYHVTSFAVEHWQKGGCNGPKPYKDDFSHLTIKQLPKFATNFHGASLFGQWKPQPVSPNTVQVNTLAVWKMQSDEYPEQTVGWLMLQLGCSYFAGLRHVNDLRRGVIPRIAYTGGDIKCTVMGYKLDLYSLDGFLTGTIEHGDKKMSNEVYYDCDSGAEIKIDPTPYATRLNEWKLGVSLHWLLTKLVTFFLKANAVQDSNDTAASMAVFEAKGKNKKGRGARKLRSKVSKRYKFSPQEYNEFLKRRDEAAGRGIVYTVDDFLDDIGANSEGEEEEWWDPDGDFKQRHNLDYAPADDYYDEGYVCSFVYPATSDGVKKGCATQVSGSLFLTATHVAKTCDKIRGMPFKIIKMDGELCLVDVPGVKSQGKLDISFPTTGEVVNLCPARGSQRPNIPVIVRSIGNTNIAGKFLNVFTGTVVAAGKKSDGLGSEPGDCGSPYIKFVNGKPTLIGIHTAGSFSTNQVAGLVIPTRFNLEGKTTFVPKKIPPETTQIWYTKYSEEVEAEMHPPLVGTKDPRNPTPTSRILEEMFKPYTIPNAGRVNQADLIAAADAVRVKLQGLIRTRITLSAENAFETLDPTTSSGYPLYCKKDRSLPGVQATIDRVQGWLDGKVKLHRPIYTAALKDEPVKQSKLDEGKKRLLWCAPLETSLACAALMTDIASQLKIMRGDWPGKVGMNPTVEWWFLDQSFGPNVLCVDYSRWDSTMIQSIYEMGVKTLFGLSDHPKAPELIDLLCQPRKVIVNDELRTVYQGLPSGIPTTSLLNCVCHWIATTIAVAYAAKISIAEAVNWPLAVYGDDEVINCPCSNFAVRYANEMRRMGFHPTNPDKSEFFHPVHKSKMEFLSRTTNYVGGRCVGALKKSSIERQLYLTRGPQHNNPLEIGYPGPWFGEQLMCVMGEASLHGEAYFNVMRDKCARAACLAHVKFEPWPFWPTFMWATQNDIGCSGFV